MGEPTEGPFEDSILIMLKHWRCSRGHRWDSTSMDAGISFNMPDMTDGLEAYCGRCMLERAREFLGRVREDDGP